MRAKEVIFNMFLFKALCISTYIGLRGIEEMGGYLWQLLAIGSPFIIGIQLTLIIVNAQEEDNA